jgi:2-polyprenyl-6-hydroxyphenyl methylase/3-demethylubiquinone-9 3-methyltransferase
VGVGATVRRRLGRFERPAAVRYRSLFIDLDALAQYVAVSTAPQRALEIGGGDGLFADALVRAVPDLGLLSIDITPDPGRLSTADPQRVAFRSIRLEELVAEAPVPFDTVLVVDVLHHVPVTERDDFLRSARALVAPGGSLVVKEWERRRNPAHAAAYASDRYLSGDHDVAFESADRWVATVRRLFPGDELVGETRVGPRPNNVALVVRAA